MKAKRTLSLLLAVLLVASLLPGALAADVPEQVDGVYQIGTADALRWFAENNETTKGADAVLTADIDLGGQAFTPIGAGAYLADGYAATFDGQGHAITGLKVSGSTNQGLFGTLNGGTIRNLKVSGSVTGTNNVGGVVGRLQTGTIENCSMAGSVTATNAKTAYAGGIVGMVNAAGAVVTGCSNTADITGTNAGGIIGQNAKKADIAYCWNAGTITGPTRSGGIAGQQSTGTISYCYNVGASACGIAGFSSATMTACYYLNDETAAPGGTAKNYEKITDAETLLANLNAGDKQRFVADSANKNGGWPLLDWQADTAAPVVPVETVTIDGTAETGATLTAAALGAEDAKATNVTWQWAISDDGETFAPIDGETNSAYTVPDTAEYAGKYIQVTAAGEADSAASAKVGPLAKSAALIAKEDNEAVQAALASLTVEPTVVKAPMTLTLPAEADGCAIAWASDHERVITAAGVVTLPEKNITTVTLTATVTRGDASATKDFAIDVWAEDVDADVYLQQVLSSMRWSFSSLFPVWGEDTNIITKFDGILKSKGYDGVTITIVSTEDESLIASDGRITYPLRPESTFADGKQVSVVFRLTVGEESVTYPESSSAILVPWALTDVSAALEKKADELLTEDVIRAENESLAAVSSELNLPSNLPGEKFDFAWVTWTSSDPEHLQVSNENRQSGADSIYNAFVGKVYPDAEAHDVTLTATITNPSTDISITRTFTVTVAPISAEQLAAYQARMEAALTYYVPKLRDFNTKAPIDPAAVTDDLQLVLPKNLLTADEAQAIGCDARWDYWNYDLSVTSADADVIDITSYRGNVYRPLGEDAGADETVTLTVTMTSKLHPSLRAETQFDLTVKHLERSELNAALELMDRAKAGYAKGLLGANTDTYSVIDSLKPYREIVWNADKTDIEYVYSGASVQGSGILVDTIPGWEDQEAWRLYRSSDPALLAHETLVLNKTPDDNTFVKLDSVFTDATFGKYYEKFKDAEGYDAEALAKFRQLYKQPVSAYFMVVGAGNYTEDFAAATDAEKAEQYGDALDAFRRTQDAPITVTFTLLGLDGTPMVPKMTVEGFSKGDTVFDVFQKVLAEKKIPYTARGSYVSEIGGLAEFDYGKLSGWMYTVGDVFVNSYMNGQTLSGGEDIVVMYVKDYTQANKHEPAPEHKCAVFQDIDMWAHDSICYVVENGIMNGTDMAKGVFAPNAKVTRAMVVTVLYRMAGEPAVKGASPFTDLKQDWYRNAVIWAAENGITNGRSETKFAPNANVTRAELVTFLMRYAKHTGQDVSARDDLAKFTDKGSVPAWAQEAMQWAVKEGVITGMTNTTLVPKGTATRAQLATVLARMLQK